MTRKPFQLAAENLDTFIFCQISAPGNIIKKETLHKTHQIDLIEILAILLTTQSIIQGYGSALKLIPFKHVLSKLMSTKVSFFERQACNNID